MTTHDGVRAALEGEQLRLHYLPVVDLATGRFRGVEALLRWQLPGGSLLGPDTFLPHVANTALMQDITGWVLRTAVTAVAAWPTLSVSVNVTADDVCRGELVAQVEDALDLAGVAPARLTVELTEQAVVRNVDAARSVLGALRARGVGLSLDDFGTGYSSLLYLRDLPVTELKIDRAFVARIPADANDMAIVASIAALGQGVGVGVVAEGVESREQALALWGLGCTSAQGFLWGRPVPAEQIDPARVHAGLIDDVAPSAVGRLVADERLQQLLAAGASPHTIAAALNRDGFRTAHHTRWSAHAVGAAIAGIPPSRPRND